MASTGPILLAEDDDNDVFLLRRAFDKAGLADRLIVVRDGQEAIWYLNGQGAYADRNAHPWPEVLLLDLKMPRMDGFDVLKWLQRRRRSLQPLLVVVHTSSKLDTDLQRAFELGADAYWLKPLHFADLVRSVRALGERLREPPKRPAYTSARWVEERL
ncbi:MAG: two-component system response regulator [Verrucomicrobia bacterium]|nr:MAG: two-component system response regulator [Verrucomicrobiota bacterium]